MGYDTFLVRVIVLLLSSILLFGTSGFTQEKAIIAGWNILGFDPIPAERIPRLAQVIRQINPDVLVLSEVNPNDVPAKIVHELGAAYQPPLILPQQAPVGQNLALLFKTGVTVSQARLVDGTDLSEEPRSRKALSAHVRIGQFDFLLIGIHLKSGRDATARRQRTRQCKAIAEFIAASTAGTEKDVLVIGDYNMIPRSDRRRPNDEANFIAMSPTNFLRFVSSDVLTGRVSHIDRCNPLRGNLLDGFAISRRFTREYIPGSTRLLSFQALNTSCASFLRDVSDHLPLVSEFRMTVDDD
jgi:exonuclease III